MHFQRNVTRIQDQDDFSGTATSGIVLKFNGQNFTPINFSLNNLNDTSIGSPSENDALIFSQAQNKWVNNNVLDGGNY